ncbi:MAG: reverse transcriptase/maturase family protein, partial [bacterium]
PSEEDNAAVISIDSLFQAYVTCRRNKRNTLNALAFESDYESNLITLCEEINNGSYKPVKSIAFIVKKPVKREIFAADFRDRVVHHLIINKLNPIFEKEFIYDSCACRTGKGAHFGIKRVNKFVRLCSVNYAKDCYILKLDIKGFFMHINKHILFNKLQKFIYSKYKARDRERVIELCRKVIYADPVKNCIIKGKPSDWKGLPKDKSLFHSPENCGLPIGNLTSQVFANFYMNTFDHFIKHDLGIIFYCRYVDDFVMVHTDKEYLKSLIPKIKIFFRLNLQLTLHPDKVYLQHYTKGVKYLGAVIKPRRIYIANQTVGNFHHAIKDQNLIVRDNKPASEEKERFLSSMNSYLGIMKHYKTYRLRKNMLIKYLSAWWFNYFYLSGGICKFVLKQKKFNKGIKPYKKPGFVFTLR